VKVATVWLPESLPSAALTVKPPVAITAGSDTFTWKVFEADWLVKSVTDTFTV
jgi:hypothetical protein